MKRINYTVWMLVYKKRIPKTLYRKIHQILPIITVDLVVKSGFNFLLVKRKNEPEANVWYFPGGRLFKNEHLLDAAKRKLREETGLSGKNYKLLGIHEHFYNPKLSYFKGFGSHVLAVVYKVEVSKKGNIKLDSQSSDFKWFSKVEKYFPSYLKKFLKISGFS